MKIHSIQLMPGGRHEGAMGAAYTVVGFCHFTLAPNSTCTSVLKEMAK